MYNYDIAFCFFELKELFVKTKFDKIHILIVT